MKIAAAYIRVSTDDQLEYSPDSQIKQAQEYAKKNGYILPQEYIFRDDGISGKDARHRPAFNQMIALSKSPEHPFDVIIVWKFSRFARNQEEAIVYKNLLKKSNVEVKSITEPITDDPFGSLIERIIEWMDEFYVINLATEVRRGMLEKVSRGGIVSVPPLGYTIDKNVEVEKRVFIPSKDAEAVREIFASFVAGEGMRSIAMRMSKQGLRTIKGNPLDMRGIEYILHNPVYVGKLRWSPEGKVASKRIYTPDRFIVVDSNHEPLIDMGTWNAAQARLDEIKKRYSRRQRPEQKVEWMLKGMVRCGDCGATLTMSADKTRLQCSKYNRGQCYISHSVSISALNQALIEALRHSIATLDFVVVPRKQASQKSCDFDKLIAAEKRKLVRVQEAYELGADSLEEYMQNKQRLLDSIASLEGEKSKGTSATTISKKEFAAQTANVLKIITSNADEKSKSEALHTIIDHIVFNRKTVGKQRTDSIDVFFYC